MKFHPLSKEEKQGHDGATHRAVITSADLTETTADTAQNLTLFTTPASKCSVECKKAVLVTAFEDASDAAFNTNALIVGDSGDTDRLLASQELNENGSTVEKKIGTGTKHVYTAATAIQANVDAMTAKSLSNVDTGEVHIYLCIEAD
jgi:hypothetical protein